MHNFLNILSKKLGMESKDLREKLGLKDNSSDQEIRNSLGIYSLFETKDDHEKYLNKKISKKEEEITKLKTFETQFTNLDSKFKQINSSFETLISNEWKNVSKDKLDFEKLLNSNIDFSNLRTSLVNFASQNNLNVIDDKDKNISDYEKNTSKRSYVLKDVAI